MGSGNSDNDNSDNTVAFIGLGGMGAGMARALLAGGFDVVVHNRTATKAAPLVEAGARLASSAADAAADAGLVMLSLSDEPAVEQVLFGEVAGRLRRGAIVIDTSTVSPAYAAAAADQLAKIGVRRVEACVLGNPAMAEAGTLRVFTAGSPEDVDACRAVLDAIGQEVVHIGPAGSASALKLAFNLILGNQVAALAEAVALAESAGIPREMMLSALARSGFSSPTLTFRAELMRERRYEPASFRSALMAKDLRLAVEHAGAHGVQLPVTATAAGRYAEIVRRNDGDKDVAIIADQTAGVRG